MKYALGNMLNGAGGLNADQLSLDLQFAADKTLTARKGPTPVFTRASTATFVGSNGLIQSANNEPRFDHDPVTLACKGLLIEESRTNFVLNSDLYTTSTATNITATTITGTSVTGSNQIRELSLTASGASTGVQASLAGTGTGNKTLSVFIKKPTSNASPYFIIGFASSALVYAGIQLTMSGSTPVISVTSTSNTFAVVSSSLETFPNGWYRVSVVVSGTAANCFPTMYPSNAVWNGISDIRQTLTASGTNLIYIFGAQVEAGSFPTSYIPTTTASVIRSADVCSITGGDFTGMYNQPEGTLFADVTPQTVDQNSFVFGVNTTSFNSSHGIYKINATVSAAGKRWVGTTINATGQAEIVTSTDVAVSKSRLAYAYKLNDFAFAANGSLVGTDTSGTVPSPTAMRIGSRDDGRAINGHLEAVRYYRKRLPNAKLQTITT